jgi:glutathione S-transferase
MRLYYFPPSTYSQKVLIALREKKVDFIPEIVDLFTPESRAAYKKVYPLLQVPVLVDGERLVPESSIIIEYVDTRVRAGAPRLIPEDPELGRAVRFHDRVFDLYVNEQARALFFDARKPAEERRPDVVAKAKEILDVTYAFLDKHLAGKTWATGDAFSMADCAAAPPLNYLRRLHPYSAYPNLSSYFHRLVERPSFARVLEEARPYLEAMKG